jgi:hypothetical protein
MRRPIVVMIVMLPGAIYACSSSTTPAQPDGSVSPGVPGGACDPAAGDGGCYPSGDPCLAVTCDLATMLCAQVDIDGGPLCATSGAACTTTAGCAEGLVCGFPATGGCGATGQCINLALACEDGEDASCTPGTPACGCNGQPDPFVITGFASAPVGSLTPCPDGGPVFEAGAVDASDASPATDGAPE